VLGWPWLAVLPLPERRGGCGGRAYGPRRIALGGAAASGARSGLSGGCVGIGAGGIRAAGAGFANVARAGAKAVKDRVVSAGSTESAAAPKDTPAWAQRMKRNQNAAHAPRRPRTSCVPATTAQRCSPSLRDEGKE